MKDNWNAYVRKDIVLEPTSEGRLTGKTFAVKDVFAVAGHTSGAGNPDWLRTHAPAERTSESVERLVGAGANMNGLTHTDELMYSLNGQNEHYGTPVNPLAPDRIPGGSSSGSAIAVAAGMADFALGTDTGGSVRVPSSYCGIFGIRPTHGVVPMDGVIPLAPSFDTVGWMARDSKLLLDVGLILLQQDEPVAVGFSQLLFPNEAWGIADRQTIDELQPLVIKLMSAVEGNKRLDIAPEGLAEWMRTFRTVQGLEIWAEHGEWIQRENPKFGPEIAARFKWASKLDKAESEPQYGHWQEIRRRMTELLNDDCLLVLPTVPGAAPPITIRGAENEARRSSTMQLSCIAGLSGLPQVTIPAGRVGGAPVGLSIIAGLKQDVKLLKWIEQNGGWSHVSKI